MNPELLQLNQPVAGLMSRARQVMGFTQQTFGDALGSSKRTAHRWEADKATPSVSQVRELAALVFPRDPVLAGQLAAAASTNLTELGLVRPPEPPPLPPAPPPAPPPPPTRLVVHAVVCVAADELAVAPDTVRRALYAAFKCARELRLSIEDVEKALEPDAPKKPAAARASRAPPPARSPNPPPPNRPAPRKKTARVDTSHPSRSGPAKGLVTRTDIVAGWVRPREVRPSELPREARLRPFLRDAEPRTPVAFTASAPPD